MTKNNLEKNYGDCSIDKQLNFIASKDGQNVIKKNKKKKRKKQIKQYFMKIIQDIIIPVIISVLTNILINLLLKYHS